YDRTALGRALSLRLRVLVTLGARQPLALRLRNGLRGRGRLFGSGVFGRGLLFRRRLFGGLLLRNRLIGGRFFRGLLFGDRLLGGLGYGLRLGRGFRLRFRLGFLDRSGGRDRTLRRGDGL